MLIMKEFAIETKNAILRLQSFVLERWTRLVGAVCEPPLQDKYCKALGYKLNFYLKEAEEMKKKDIIVPLDVPRGKQESYINNYWSATRNSGRLMLFAGDQKIEHLNKDFYGDGIHPDDADPEHLFRVASKAKIGVFATQLGLIARYGMDYKKVQYLVKLNSKTNLVKTDQDDPYSELLIDVEQVVKFEKNSGLKILGVGFTIYLGSQYESRMLRNAAQIIYEAHQNGMIAVLWIYPRGKAVKDERDPHLIAGATGVGACLGADFVKVNYPRQEGAESKEIFKEAIMAAGRTRVICAGGSAMAPAEFLKTLADQIEVGAAGNATGRNIHQKGQEEAVSMCNAIYAITVEGKSVDEALKIYEQGK
jgi:fructose-bisphosphate aldolase/6-deoxy-5-ketofructose 1-phosphate synthase